MSKKKIAKKKIAKKTTSKAQPKEQKKVFLVMNMDKNARTGSSMIILHVTKSYNEALSYIEKMQGASPGFVCIVEQKAVLSRQPQITISLIDRDIVNQ